MFLDCTTANAICARRRLGDLFRPDGISMWFLAQKLIHVITLLDPLSGFLAGAQCEIYSAAWFTDCRPIRAINLQSGRRHFSKFAWVERSTTKIKRVGRCGGLCFTVFLNVFKYFMCINFFLESNRLISISLSFLIFSFWNILISLWS